MQFFKSLIEQSLSRTREASLSVLGINDSGLRNHLSAEMNNTLGNESSFIAPPVFEHTFGWEPASTTLNDLQGKLFSPALLNTLEKAHAYQFPKTMIPYKHQLKAWTTLLADEPRSTVITSGTGSGKTECFMVPILQDLIREREQLNQPLVGVRALFLYPLNALINSQQERLDAWTKAFGQDIRFCLYNGNTEEKAEYVRQEQKLKPNQQLSRESLRENPAPILLTNATMLEYMLVRQIDSPILEKSRADQSLRWIVLDEAHTYIGSQAAELSLLLRRVIHAFGRKAEDIRFIATSATIADKNAEEKLRDYLAGLAGIQPSHVIVIGGKRVWPAITQRPIRQLTLDDISQIETAQEISEARYQALEESHIATELRNAVVNNERPLNLNELVKLFVNKLDTQTQEERQQELLSWLDLMTGTKKSLDEQPFLKLRVHLFQRMLHGLWSCVDPKCSVKTNTLSNWPFGKVYVTQRVRCECTAPVYELAFCHECRAPHLVAEEKGNGELHQCSPYAGDEFALSYEPSEEDASEKLQDEQASTQGTREVVLAPSVTELEQFQTIILDGNDQKLGKVNADHPITIRMASSDERCCSVCHEGDRPGKSFLDKAYLGAPFYVANAVPTVLEYCPDPDKKECGGKSPAQLPGRGRKLITFTDSRQGAARMAIRMQQEAERSKLRGLVFQTLRNKQLKQDAEQKDTQEGSPEELIEIAKLPEERGLKNRAEATRAEAEKLRQGLSTFHTQIALSWKEITTELAAFDDISQFIPDYNKYTNPQLFGDETAGLTMARLLLAREFSRRPKKQNSSETIGLVSIGYQGLDNIKSTPQFWEETSCVAMEGESSVTDSQLTLQDWKDFLKVSLDFYVRENTFIRMDRAMQNWMGSKFYPKVFVSPDSNEVESSTLKKWPQIKPTGGGNRLVKLLELGTGLDKSISVHKDKINFWLKSAWKDLTEKARVLEQAENGWALKLENITFSLPVTAWVCPVTHRLIDTTFRGLTPYLPGNYKKKDYSCRKIQLPVLTKLAPDSSGISKESQIRKLVSKNQTIQHIRQDNLWTNINDRVVEGGFYYRTAEHSAQQSSKALESYEEKFKTGKVNVLNCSTTMEMGVDIGGISAVVMNNVPPHPANYLQRAGRAGRRSESRAIAYTLCKNNPHDQRAFSFPIWPFVTAIPAPSITLSSNRIVQRHVNSLALSIFLKTQVRPQTDKTKLNLKWFYSCGENSVCNSFIGWLASTPNELEDPVRILVNGTGLSGRSLSGIFSDGIDILKTIEDKWSSEHQTLLDHIKNAHDGAYKKALKIELQRHEEEYLLRDLAVRAFLPGYGFPTNVVSLNTYNVEDFMQKQNRKTNADREDNIYTAKGQPNRGLDIAIREYAPGSQIVIDGRVYRSAGVSLQWHTQGEKKEAQSFNIAWRCNACGAGGVTEKAYSQKESLTCTHCQAAIKFSETKMVLRPEGFTTDFFESTSNDVSSQKFIKVERPRIQLVGESIPLPDSRCGHIRYGHDGTVFYHSSGEHEKGYAICMGCGRAESMTSTGAFPQSLSPDKPHRPIGGLQGAHKEKDCQGSIMTDIHLGYQMQTDVLELFLKNPSTGEWLSSSREDQALATTISVALRDIIADRLGISSTEMGFGYRLDKDLATGQGRSVVQIFDLVSGGAGFVIEGVSDIAHLLQQITKKLSCPVQCDNVCSHCLAGNDSRVEQEELNRRAALEWFTEGEFQSFLALPDTFSAVPDATYCSFDPLRFIRTVMNKTNADDRERVLQIILSGDHDADWDTAYPVFREQLLTWAIADKFKVRLLIDRPERLDEANKRSLLTLKELGIDLAFLEEDTGDPAVSLVAQVISGDGCITLLSSHTKMTEPGEHWLQPTGTETLVSSKAIPPATGLAADTSDWKVNPSGSQIIEVTDQLNGTVVGLSSRLKKLLSKHSPELITQLETDQVVSVDYSDRYLKSPWSLMLLSGFLYLFEGESLAQACIRTLESKHPHQGRLINHDWHKPEDQKNIIIDWMKQLFDCPLDLTIENDSRNLLHGRMITLEWASGKTSKIILDQGMGYWKTGMPYVEREFDFYADVNAQLQATSEKFSRANMVNGGQWPTFISVIADVP